MSDTGRSATLAPNCYFDRHFQCDAVKILPGEYYATAGDRMIVTVLGSCVAVCLRDRDSGIGGMNHFMLPGGAERDAIAGSDARYGGYAMEILINHLLRLGAARPRLEAKVFGGGRVLDALAWSQVGERNARFALRYLALENIPVTAQDLLDVHPRKIYFFPEQGRVLVRKLKSLHNNTIVERDLEYGQRLRHTTAGGEIELF
jgi:chemotaxis protein CheD